ncbi:hypothetical protein Rhal01_00940 [Rubritalea halochordaticola]|uniref:DUF4328 domain-containing protein n=1 Tax=Rubritalea halochordaticola TaxID=714537 RepID=A0ABP9UWD5_9BACT
MENPYQAPTASAEPTFVLNNPTQANSPYGPMKDHTGISRVCMVLLGLFVLLGVTYCVYSLKLAGDMDAGINPFLTPAGMLDEQVYDTYMAMSRGVSLMFILIVVFFCIWTNRSMKNAWAVPGLLTKPTVTPGWAVGWYFIPIMMLFKPLSGMKEIWSRTFSGASHKGLLNVWWLTWIIGGIVQRMNRATENDSLSEISSATYAEVVGLILVIIAGVCLMAIVYKVTNKQAELCRSYVGDATNSL